MLRTTLTYKDVFVRLVRCNPQYDGLPDAFEWSLAQKICDKLEIFYGVTQLFLGSKVPTANIFVSSGTAINGSQYTFAPVTATFTSSTTFITSVVINDNSTCDGNTNVIFGLNNNFFEIFV